MIFNVEGGALDASKDNNICINNITHQYVLINNPSIVLTSTTRFLNECIYDEFDAIKSSHKPQSNLKHLNSNICIAERHEGVLANWEFTRQVGTNLHTLISEYINCFVNNKRTGMEDDSKNTSLCTDLCRNKLEAIVNEYDPIKLKNVWESSAVQKYAINEYHKDKMYGLVHSRLCSFERIYNFIFKHLELIATEYMVYDTNHKLCGTIDALFWEDKSKRTAIIVDWKTCASFTTYPVKIKNEFSPFLGQSKSKLDRYFCQLHVYSKILENNYNVHVVAGYIVMFNADGSFALFHKHMTMDCPCTDSLN